MTLSCEWRKPVHSYFPVSFYQVNLTLNGAIAWKAKTREFKIETKDKLIDGELYIVSVGAVAHKEGETAETHVFLPDFGETISLKIFTLTHQLYITKLKSGRNSVSSQYIFMLSASICFYTNYSMRQVVY